MGDYVTGKYRQRSSDGQADPETRINERIQDWRRGPHRVSKVERICYVTGWHGCGKTRLLQWIADRFDGRYLDLETRARHATPQAFKNYATQQLQVGQRSGLLLLCVDHVPPDADDALRLLEEEILHPAWEEGIAFLLMAQQHPRRSCWVALPRLDPLWIPSFTSKGCVELLKQLGCKDPNIQGEIHRISDGHPMLIKKLWDGYQEPGDYVKYVKGAREFLEYWLRRVGAEEDLDTLLRFAYPLSLVEDLSDTTSIGKALNAYSVHERPARARTRLQQVWWIEARRTNKGFAYYWVEPVQRCVEYLFKAEHPQEYKKVEQALQESRSEGGEK